MRSRVMPDDFSASPMGPLLSAGEGEEEVLAGDVLVLELLGLVLRLVQIAEQPLAEARTRAALDLGKALQRLVDAALDQAGIGPDAAKERLGHALLLGEQRFREMLGLDLGGAMRRARLWAA